MKKKFIGVIGIVIAVIVGGIYYLTREEKIELSFNQIKDATGFDIDHSFLTYKKELLDYGYKVEKIKLKDKIIIFSKYRY